MKEKFKKLADSLRKRPSDSCSALKKIFPEGLKLRWLGDKWEICGPMMLDGKGGTEKNLLLL
jgi:hypothetical protein